MARTPGFPRGELPAAPDRAPDVPPGRPRTADLQARLERLPPGHPSSPYDADTTERTPVLEPGFRFSEADWADHKEDTAARRGAADAAGKNSIDAHTIDRASEVWAADRKLAHEAIVERIYEAAKDVPNEREAIIAGGLCGAGKTTVLESHSGIDKARYVTISPDNIKEELAGDGLIPEVDGLSPMEASDLVHRESSHIARQLAAKAMSDGKNLIWDIQMSSARSVKERIDHLRAAGYDRVDAVFVDIPVGLSLERADARHREGEEKYRSGIGLGGRYVPPGAITSQADPEFGSTNRRALEECRAFLNHVSVYDNSGDGPRLVESNWPDR